MRSWILLKIKLDSDHVRCGLRVLNNHVPLRKVYRVDRAWDLISSFFPTVHQFLIQYWSRERTRPALLPSQPWKPWKGSYLCHAVPAGVRNGDGTRSCRSVQPQREVARTSIARVQGTDATDRHNPGKDAGIGCCTASVLLSSLFQQDPNLRDKISIVYVTAIATPVRNRVNPISGHGCTCTTPLRTRVHAPAEHDLQFCGSLHKFK